MHPPQLRHLSDLDQVSIKFKLKGNKLHLSNKKNGLTDLWLLRFAEMILQTGVFLGSWHDFLPNSAAAVVVCTHSSTETIRSLRVRR